MRRAAKRDGNEMSIASALREAGYLVKFQNDYDLLVSRAGWRHCYLIEVKSKNGRLTSSQRKMIEEGWPLNVVWSGEEAFEALEESV